MTGIVEKRKVNALSIYRAPAAGFYVGERNAAHEYSAVLAAFSTLDEALAFVSAEMAEETSA